MEDDHNTFITNLVTTRPFRAKVVNASKEDFQNKDQTSKLHTDNSNIVEISQSTRKFDDDSKKPFGKRKLPKDFRKEDPGKNDVITKVPKREPRLKAGVPPNRCRDHNYIPSQHSKNYVSSLFHNNPEVPAIIQKDIDTVKESIFATKKFNDLGIHPYMVANLRDVLKIEIATVVQEKVMPLICEGKDLLIKSQTGSGKTVAYAVPIIQNLQARRPKLHRSSGIFALVILPTRELAIQTYELFRNLCRSFQWLVPHCFMGGQKVKSEKAGIRRGINILISTPQRLLEHIRNSSKLILTEIQWLVLDEADRLMDLGYEKDITTIVEEVRKNSQVSVQTILLSATLNDGVDKLAGLSLQNPTVVDVSGEQTGSTDFRQLVCPSELQQHFLVVPAKLRLVTLAAFVFWKCSGDQHKIIIFMATQDMVEFHTTLLRHIAESEVQKNNDGKEVTPLNICISQLHGNMNQQDRIDVFNKYRQAKTGILLCTDVGARGLDLTSVDWIVQYTTPNSAAEYVHRVGRTARIGGAGNAVLFLLPSEQNFIVHMEEHNIRLEPMLINDVLESLPRTSAHLSSVKNKQGVMLSVEVAATQLQGRCEEAVLKDSALQKMAVQSFASYIRAYASYSVQLRKLCPYKELHLGHLAKSMALRDTPTRLGHASSTQTAVGGRNSSKGHNTFHPDRFDRDQHSYGTRRNTEVDMLSEFASGMS